MSEFERWIDDQIARLYTAYIVESQNKLLIGDGTGVPTGIKNVHTITTAMPGRSVPWTCKRGVWAQR